MKYLKYLYYFIVIVAVSILYDKYKKRNATEDQEKNQELVKKYLLNEKYLHHLWEENQVRQLTQVQTIFLMIKLQLHKSWVISSILLVHNLLIYQLPVFILLAQALSY